MHGVPAPFRRPIHFMRIDHINIVVSDMERAVAFYRDVLGMTQSFEATLEGAWIETVTGLPDLQARCVFMQFETGDVRLELLQYLSPRGENVSANRFANTPGVRHMAFETPDLDALAARLEAGGVALLSLPVTVPFLVGPQRLTKRLCYFHDPDGTLLEAAAYSAAETSSPEPAATTRDA